MYVGLLYMSAMHFVKTQRCKIMFQIYRVDHQVWPLFCDSPLAKGSKSQIIWQTFMLIDFHNWGGLFDKYALHCTAALAHAFAFTPIRESQ